MIKKHASKKVLSCLKVFQTEKNKSKNKTSSENLTSIIYRSFILGLKY